MVGVHWDDVKSRMNREFFQMIIDMIHGEIDRFSRSGCGASPGGSFHMYSLGKLYRKQKTICRDWIRMVVS